MSADWRGPGVTADIAIAQGATLALFFAFSANARNVIFADASGVTSHLLLRTRLVLLLPMAVPCFILSSTIGSVNAALTIALIGRRSAEWIGEIYLSASEVQNNRKPAMLTIAAECSTFILAIGLIFSEASGLLWRWFVGGGPAHCDGGGKTRKVSAPVNLIGNLGKLAPNLGSTTIIGIAVYVFRLSITMVTGRITAGDLFTAFVIGGLIPTIYNSSIGPSLALREHGKGTKGLALRVMTWLVPGLFILGSAIAAFTLQYPEHSGFLNKSHNFWTAVGMSLSGGGIMMIALHRRILMLQKGMNVEIFGSDVLSNVLIVVSVPYFYFLLGPRSLEGLFVFNAVLTLFCYWSAERTGALKERPGRYDTLKLFAIAGLVLLPFFIQLNGSIFRDTTFLFDTGRVLRQLPVPLSVIAIIGGVLMLGRFKETHRSLTVFFFTAVLLVLATLSIQEPDARSPRLILMAQYLIPFLGLVLGRCTEWRLRRENSRRPADGGLLRHTLATACSWARDWLSLRPIYIFSVSINHSLRAVVMVLSYGMAFTSLQGSDGPWKTLLWLMLPLAAIYAAASYSLEVFVIYAGMIGAGVWRHRTLSLSRRAAAWIIGLVLVSGIAYGVFTQTSLLVEVASPLSSVLERSDAKYRLTRTLALPRDTAELWGHWQFYGKGIVAGAEEFFFGHAYPPDRSVHPSAHNYYLDLLYNFGVLPLAPLLVLLIYSGLLVYRLSSLLRSDWFLLASVLGVLIMFGVDNSLKVGLRQPYPGIFGFFLLGLLQARLSRGKGPLH